MIESEPFEGRTARKKSSIVKRGYSSSGYTELLALRVTPQILSVLELESNARHITKQTIVRDAINKWIAENSNDEMSNKVALETEGMMKGNAGYLESDYSDNMMWMLDETERRSSKAKKQGLSDESIIESIINPALTKASEVKSTGNKIAGEVYSKLEVMVKKYEKKEEV